jgi:hypothetical protein
VPAPGYKKKRFVIPGVIVVLLVIGGLFGDDGTTPTATTEAGTNATAGTQPPETTPDTPPETEPPTQPASAALGDTMQFEDALGNHSADVTVVRKRVSTGGAYDKPDRGLYVGLFVRVKAFKDGISVPSFYVLAGGKHVDSTCCRSGFTPELTAYGNLNNGEASEGWLIFDVPSRSGQLVLEEFGTQEAQAYWSF